MAADAVALLVAACGAAALVSWLLCARTSTRYRREHSLAAAGATAAAIVVQLAQLRGGLHGPWQLLELVAVTLVALAVLGGLDAAGSPAAGVPGLAEAALSATCLLTLVWALTGRAHPPLAVLWPLALALTLLTLSSLLLQVARGRTGGSTREAGVDPGLRPVAGVGALALGAAAVGQVVVAWLIAGSAVPSAVSLPGPMPAQLVPGLVAAVALLAAAVVPWYPLGESRPVRPAPQRAFPVPLIAAVALAVAWAVVRGTASWVTVSLSLLVVLLVLLLNQAYTLREKHTLSSSLSRLRARMAALVENAGDVILGLDSQGRVDLANQAATSVLRRPPEDLVGEEVAELAAVAESGRVHRVVQSVVAGGLDAARIEFRLAPPASGTVELRLRRVPGGAVANLSDVTEAVELRERLDRMARTDSLTGLANRQHLTEHLGRWLDAGGRPSVLYVDLDGFKAVNDRFGHAAGDQVLREVAQRLTAAAEIIEAGTRDAVALGRMSGDEFALALRRHTLHQAVLDAEHVLAALREPFQLEGRQFRVGASIGAAAVDDGGRTRPGREGADDLVCRADIAMSAAKQSDRAQVQPWDEATQERVMRKVDVAIALRRALDDSRLALAYQPIVRLADGVIVGAEALIRLHPVGGSATDDLREDAPQSLARLADLVTPAELVEVAEGTGEIDELGHWVLAEATRQAAKWQDVAQVGVNVNMSVRQLSDPGFVDAVRRALAEAALDPSLLVIEITEGQMLAEGDRASLTIRRLRGDGVQFAIDDFGSGYSSLSYLRRMPVHTVKIDRRLLEGVGSDPRATTLGRAVLGAARGLGLAVVCEGIENLDTARAVRDLGAWAGQGFALHAAMASADFQRVLTLPPAPLREQARAR